MNVQKREKIVMERGQSLRTLLAAQGESIARARILVDQSIMEETSKIVDHIVHLGDHIMTVWARKNETSSTSLLFVGNNGGYELICASGPDISFEETVECPERLLMLTMEE